MGNWGSRYITNPAGTPDHHKPPSFDPMYGFPNGRKERGTFVLFSIGKGNTFVFVRGYVVKFLRKSSTTDPFTLIEYSFRHKHYSHYIISVHIRQRLQKQNRQSAVSFMKKKNKRWKFIFFLVMIATEEEMMAAKIPLKDRDYCAHKLIDYRQCRQEVWPWAYQCAHEKHAYLTCKFDEWVLSLISPISSSTFTNFVYSYIIRMKEYEREKRLLRRNQRIEKGAA